MSYDLWKETDERSEKDAHKAFRKELVWWDCEEKDTLEEELYGQER